MPRCGTCHYHEQYIGVCCHGESDRRADFTSDDESCEHWCIREAIAIDFDGCLCTNAWPQVGSPNWRAINEALDRKRNGSSLILWTCREGPLLQEAIEACRSWGLEFDAVNESTEEWIEEYGTRPRKIGASEYWDDKAVNVEVS